MKEQASPTQKALNIWAIILILWSIYRANFGVSVPVWIDEMFIKPFFFVLPVVWYITKIEKKNFFKRVDLHIKTLPKDLVLGVIFGLIFFFIGYIAVGLKKGSFTFLPFQSFFTLSTLSLFCLAIITSLSEEILSRGFVLKHLYEESKNIVNAIFISSLLFFFLHIPILFTSEHMTGPMLLQVMTTDIVLSVAVSLVYLQRRSLILPIIIHACYIFSLSFFI